MASQTFLANGLARSLPYVTASAVAVLVALYFRTRSRIPHSPKPFERLENNEYTFNAKRMLGKWFDAYPDEPIGVDADTGPITVLPPHMAHEIRNDKRLSATMFFSRAFHTHLPGFEPLRGDSEDAAIIRKVVIKDLTKQLNKVTEPLAEETSQALSDILSDSHEWHEISLRETILRLIARISSRVFLGDELCRSQDWLRVTREYTITLFKAAERLRKWPVLTRPVVNWFLRECRDSRVLVAEARRIMQPVLERRQKLKAEARAQGKPLPAFNDAIEWFDNESHGRNFDAAMIQLAISLAAIHTTSDLTCQTLTDIAQHAEILEPLRKEILSVLGQYGWQKESLYKMKLLDSVIKESQRLKPISMVTMTRIALEEVVLFDGTVVPKGGAIGVSSHNMWDSKAHDGREEWDGYRFYNMRQETPDKQHVAQLVATSPEHLAFGHGMHACPGRFFAANEVKIALATILLKYDFKLPAGAVPKVLEFGFNMGTDPFLKMSIRRRSIEERGEVE